ncbi:Crp/Fnr family transcriptional regulator [Lederbergia galactosidilytica]|uniref:Crp/Fnr family transcriptional regulator n=1 Tax=Lederbergia galactosidilytica TaxID=217031 RepID=A0A0Q9XMJ4_9BACI|nr:Crp/Fnr family transcriptional regulator [Lederbergia galactosidilytica]
MNDHTYALLQQIVLFSDLTTEEINKVKDITISRSFPKKAIIFSEGSMKEAVYFIVKGLVKTYKTDEKKTYKTDENGYEQIVSFLKTGDMFPHTGFFDTKPYPATAEALVDTQLLAIPIQLFEQLVMNTPSIAIKMMRVMGTIIKDLQERLQGLSGKDVKQRAISLLLKLADKHGERRGNSVTINLPITNQELANFVGTSRETINRLFSQIGKKGILKVERNRIIIVDLAGLKEQLD